MSLERLAGRLYNNPLLLAPEKAEAIERVFRAHVEGTVASLPAYEKAERQALSSMLAASYAPQRGGYLRSDESGIAIVSAVGSMVQRANGLDAMSGIESYESIAARFSAAMADPKVKGILLEVDSYGGEGTGIAALGDLVRAGHDSKPVIAHANEIAFSAGYWLASSAGELYVPKTGMVGSIGVILMHVDQSRANDKRGFEVTHIHAGARKADFSPHKPLSEEAMNRGQRMVDTLYGHFVDHVVAARGMTAAAVRKTEAGLLHADEAEKAGLVDGVASFDETLQRLAEVVREPKKRKQYGGAAASAQLSSTAQPSERDEIMSDATKGAAPTENAATTFTQQQLDSAIAKARAEEKASAVAGAEAVKTAERERVFAITNHAEAKGREGLAAHLARSDMSVDAAAAILAAAPKDSAAAAAPVNALAAKMAAEAKNPVVGASATSDGEESEEEVGKRIAGHANASKLRSVKK